MKGGRTKLSLLVCRMFVHALMVAFFQREMDDHKDQSSSDDEQEGKT